MFRKSISTMCLKWALVGALALPMLAPAPSRAADHRDGPRITDINNTPAGALDLNDLYIFVSPTNRNNTVLIMTMSPGAGIVGPARFFPNAAYELRISNDGNPSTDEIVFQAVFSEANASGAQQYTIRRIGGGGPATGTVVARGVTNARRASRILGGGQVTAGIFDDPFFFDVNATARFNREATLLALNRTEGRPLPADITPTTNPARHFFAPNFPNNFFGGFNTLAIAFEVPRLRIQSSRSNPNITAWMRSVADVGDGRGFAQFDRMGNPGINTVVVPLTRTIAGEVLASGLQDQFNFLTPADDPSLRPIAIDRLVNVLGLPLATATALANAFLPDVVTFNTTDRSGFPNGRRLPDDVIDIELGLLSAGALTTDRVNNDSYFRGRFPYLGHPNPANIILQSATLASIRAEQEAARKGQ